MASLVLFGSLCTFLSLSPSLLCAPLSTSFLLGEVLAICANVYVWWWNEWVEAAAKKRNVNGGKFVEGGLPFLLFPCLAFHCPPHIVCTHKFSNPLFCVPNRHYCCCCYYYYFVTFYVHPHVPSILFFSALVFVLVTFLSIFLFQLCMGFCCSVLPSTEHVENIINFISYGLTPVLFRLPTFSIPPLKHRSRCLALRKLLFWHFPRIENFVKLILFQFSEKKSGKSKEGDEDDFSKSKTK